MAFEMTDSIVPIINVAPYFKNPPSREAKLVVDEFFQGDCPRPFTRTPELQKNLFTASEKFFSLKTAVENTRAASIALSRKRPGIEIRRRSSTIVL